MVCWQHHSFPFLFWRMWLLEGTNIGLLVAVSLFFYSYSYSLVLSQTGWYSIPVPLVQDGQVRVSSSFDLTSTAGTSPWLFSLLTASAISGLAVARAAHRVFEIPLYGEISELFGSKLWPIVIAHWSGIPYKWRKVTLDLEHCGAWSCDW